MVHFLVVMLMLLFLPPQSSLGGYNVVAPLNGGHSERPGQGLGVGVSGS
jgi:hypothetical protein